MNKTTIKVKLALSKRYMAQDHDSIESAQEQIAVLKASGHPLYAEEDFLIVRITTTTTEEVLDIDCYTSTPKYHHAFLLSRHQYLTYTGAYLPNESSVFMIGFTNNKRDKDIDGFYPRSLLSPITKQTV